MGPNERPCWAWFEDSCSLDSVLLMAMILQQLIPDTWLNIGIGIYSICFYTFRAMVREWGEDYKSWSEYPAGVMTKARDNCRSLLQRFRILISKKSSTHDIFSYFIVNQLTTWQFTLVSDCESPACKKDNKQDGINITGVRSYTPSILSVPGKWLKNSDTQRVIDMSVFLFLN